MGSKIMFQHIKNKSRFWEGSMHLSWPSNPLPHSPSNSHRPFKLPLRLPNLDPSKPSLLLVESKFYLLAPKQRGEQHWRPWIARVEELDSTTWRVLHRVHGFDNILEAEAPLLGTFGVPSNYLIKELYRSYNLIDLIKDQYVPLCSGDTKVIPLMDPTLKLLTLDRFGKLAIWKEGDEKWTNIVVHDHNDRLIHFSDICSFRGKLYASDGKCRVFEIKTTEENDRRIVTEAININDNHLMTVKHRNELAFVEYNDQLCLLHYDKFGTYSQKAALYATRRAIENSSWDIEIIKNLKNQVVFKINDTSFTLPVCLLDRKFQEEWICLYNNASSRSRYCSYAPIEFDPADERLKPLEDVRVPNYEYGLEMCELNFDTFYQRPYHDFRSLFLPPPAWLKYYFLDADRVFPSIRFY